MSSTHYYLLYVKRRTLLEFILYSKEIKHVKGKLRELELKMGFPPVILQADNKKEFTASKINDLISN
jgi:hypothetical protein